MATHDIYGDPIENEKKYCIYCGELKSLDQFNLKLDNFDRHDNRCRQCKNKRSKEVWNLKKYAPPMVKECQICKKKLEEITGRKFQNFCLDHDPTTGNFRGWLCRGCNTSIGHFGDTAVGVYKAFNYLMETLSENQKVDVLREIISLYPEEEREVILAGYSEKTKEILNGEKDG